MIWLLRKINLCIKTSSNGYVISVIVKSHKIAPKEHSTLKVSFSHQIFDNRESWFGFECKIISINNLLKYVKVHIFWEGHKILRNLHQLFVLCTASQIIGGDFAKFCGLLRIYEQ